MTRRTKIVCTVGPASSSPATLEKMMRFGMDMARLNFSHAAHADHRRLIKAIRSSAEKVKKHTPILGDLQGPKIRLGALAKAGVMLQRGDQVSLTTATGARNTGEIPVTYKNLHKNVKKGHRILIDDGMIELHVTRVVGRNIQTKVVSGGKITSHKGMNFPDSTLHLPTITAKDKKDAVFAIKQHIDWIALSFVTGPASVKALKRFIKQHTPKGKVFARVMVKIETRQAIERFDEILRVADAIMISRGDLGVEIDAQDVPVRQKELIHACLRAGKQVVVATQMLESMIYHPRPTRAEVSDVAGAVFDCASAVMLSGESAIGAYPVQAVRMMAKIVKRAEASCYDDQCGHASAEF